MDKQNIIDNWDNYYKSYLELNKDLVFAGINSKRSSLNHFIKYGYDEGRKITNTDIPVLNTSSITTLNENYLVDDKNKIHLEEKMIIEKIDLNI